mmetsp:Transcript_30201/g.64743  ORF Transcript_30201/g.64743 Transcript_30201/m.64743 type:complete len:543 (-) Transcript_30201:202-1830(-)
MYSSSASSNNKNDNKSSLRGKVAVVTGSTQGLGEATLRLFQKRGCSGLVVTGRDERRGNKLARDLTTSTCKVVFVRADLASIDDCRRLMRVTDETFGTIDILVNAAATTDRGSLWDTTPEDYDRIMNVNTRAPFFLMQDAARIMERQNVGGSIVNISSTASYGSMPMLSAYGMSKGALNVATKNAAYSLMWSKIRVNALAIGWMDTPGEDDIQRRLHNQSGGGNWKEQGERNQPFGRLLQPDEVARCIAFCASEESGMMTGCVVDFDQSVFGAGNAPVPPRKDEWARAKGMTFSFEDAKKQQPPRMATKPQGGGNATTEAAASVGTAKTRPRSKSPVSGGLAAARARAKPSSPSPARRRWPPSSSSPSSLKRTVPRNDDDDDNGKAADSKPEEPPPPSSSDNDADDESDDDDNDNDDESDDEPYKPVARTTTTTTATTGDEPKESGASTKFDPAEQNYPDEDRPDPTEFLNVTRQRDGDVFRPDEYLPGTEPYGYYSKKEETKPKQKSLGNPECYGKSRVDDWLGSGKKPKRTWKVKKVTTH